MCFIVLYSKFWECALFIQINACILQIEKNRGDKGGFGPLQSLGSGKIENSFSDLSISSSGTGFASGSGFGLNSDVDSFSTKSKGWFSWIFVNSSRMLLNVMT